MSKIRDFYNVVKDSSPIYVPDGHAIEILDRLWVNFEHKTDFEFDVIADNKIRIPIYQTSFTLFKKTAHFQALIDPEIIKKDILILDDTTQQVMYFEAS